ncbi:hypothetical protein [Paenibacillus sp. GCM10027626]|uniref:hypothetical protein n=1 Tax=Paenibacillus sp. GCM10027626 TaxID=3273411 RepID=UPI00364579D9
MKASPLQQLKVLICFVIASLSLTGCNYVRHSQDSTYDYGSKQKGDPKMIGSRMYGTANNNPEQHNNRWFEYSSQLSTIVTNINGVAAGMVFLTDKNAYVGMTLDRTAVGTRKTGGRKSKEQNNSGVTWGPFNPDTGSPYRANRVQFASPYNSYYTVNDHNEISSELKQTIAVQLRKLAPLIQEVHISANMEFVNHLAQYAYEAKMGHSLTRWLPSFNMLVQHQFAGGDLVPEPLDVQKRKLQKSQH